MSKTQHTTKTKDGGARKFPHYTRGFAIKAFCTECMGWEGTPMDCSAKQCPLWPFRGKTIKTMEGDA